MISEILIPFSAHSAHVSLSLCSSPIRTRSGPVATFQNWGTIHIDVRLEGGTEIPAPRKHPFQPLFIAHGRGGGLPLLPSAQGMSPGNSSHRRALIPNKSTAGNGNVNSAAFMGKKL